MLNEPTANPHRRYAFIAVVAALTLAALTQFGWSQTGSDATSSLPTVLKDPASYGFWVLTPALATIILAIIVRQVIPALTIGILIAAYMMLPCMDHSAYSSDTYVAAIRVAVEKYVIGGIAPVEDGKLSTGHLYIIVFTLLIGGMVGVIGVNGGTRALVDRVAKFASTSRKGQLSAWLAGMVVFFDDYANSMLVGPTMRPMFDKLSISRAKLAYIVDSTAAPVASIAFIGTWVGAELGFIQTGMDAARANMPEYLAAIDNKTAFLQSIPYRFYAILALWMVFVIALTGRDFGPMRKSESRALTEYPDAGTSTAIEREIEPTNAWLAGLPILVLVGATLTTLYYSGLAGLGDEARTFSNIIKNADSYIAILYGAIASLTVAVILSFITRACSIRAAFDGCLDGMSRMFPAIVVLVLAWGLSSATEDLKLGAVASEYIQSTDFSREWLPLLIFISAAVVSFATGTSWGTMGILTPVAVQIAATLVGDLPQDQGLQLFYASVGSVLAGSIFGDHCSPISDTTVLSSIATGCTVEEHVWTQMPYALITAVVAMIAGNIICMMFSLPHWVGIAIGAAALFAIVRWIGREPRKYAA